MRSSRRWSAFVVVAAAIHFAAVVPLSAQLSPKATRPQVKPPDGQVRKVIFKNCTSCHGIDDYAYNALDRDAWNALLESKHKSLATMISDSDRGVLLDWLAVRFGPDTKPFPRTYVPPEINTFLTDSEGEALVTRACTRCHGADRVNDARNSAEAWRVVIVDMRERGAKVTDEELEKLVEWLGRVKGTNANN
jgi:mono/diheme cytochrome c family protein